MLFDQTMIEACGLLEPADKRFPSEKEEGSGSSFHGSAHPVTFSKTTSALETHNEYNRYLVSDHVLARC